VEVGEGVKRAPGLMKFDPERRGDLPGVRGEALQGLDAGEEASPRTPGQGREPLFVQEQAQLIFGANGRRHGGLL